MIQCIGFLMLAIVMCYPAFDNGFPFLHPDTSSYLICGFDYTIGEGRTWSYAGFLRHCSLNTSPWLLVLVQNILLLLSVQLFLKTMLAKAKVQRYHLPAFVFFVGLPTAVSYHSSMLMPDIFTPIVLLCFTTLLVAHKLVFFDKLIASALLFVALLMHNSHLIIAFLLLSLLWLAYAVPAVRLKFKAMGLGVQRLLKLSAVLLVAYFSLCSIHYAVGGEFRAARGGGVFLFARLCDYGLAQQYLDATCTDKQDDLCAAKASLGMGRHFLWDRSNVFYKNGGWTRSNEAYYAGMSKKILQQPEYLTKYITKSIESGIRQFFSYDFDPLNENHQVEWVANEVQKRFPNYRVDVRNSKQFLKVYRPEMADTKNLYQHLLILLALFSLSSWLLYKKPEFDTFCLATTVLIVGILLNAALAAAGSGVYPRYQSRVAWLIILPLFCLLANVLQLRFAPQKTADN